MPPTAIDAFYSQIAAQQDVFLLWFLAVAVSFTGVQITSRFIALPALPFQLPTLPEVPRRVQWPAILIAALAARLPALQRPLWYDETFTATLARLDLQPMLTAIMADVHPPLPYLIEWLSIRLFGFNEFALRLPALAAGLLLIYLIYKLAIAMRVPASQARLAALLCALMPAAINYGTEARQYSLLACLALAACIAIIQDKRRLFIVCAGLLAWTHNIGFAYLAVLGLSALLYHKGRRWRAAAVYAGVMGALWLPGLLQQSSDVADGFWLWQTSLGGVLQSYISMTFSKTLPANAVMLVAHTSGMLGIVWSLWATRRRWNRTWFVWLVLVAGVPIVVASVSLLWRPVFLDRALLACGLALCIPMAVLAATRPPARLVLLLAMAASVFGFFSTGRLDLSRAYSACTGADSVFFTSTAAAIQGGIQAPAVPHFLWAGANDLNQTLPDSAKHAIGFNQRTSPPSGTFCVPTIYSPLQSQSETNFIEMLKLSHAWRIVYQRDVNQFFSVVVYVFG